MQAYRVGGSVRDELLGLPVVDRDWVVVGATPQQMIDQGFRPVGKDFPVFLHPLSKEEYALARTERKTGPGYKGFAVHFSPGVTLEEDLARRDLTINAMAQAADGSITDPFGGRQDIADRVLRHVSESFTEDPVRILRLARFAARFADFRVAPETMALMQRMTAAGEVNALVAERVWQEVSRGLQEIRPSRMIEVLREAGALQVLLPELEAPGPLPAPDPSWSAWLRALDRCAARKEALPVSYAVLLARAGATSSEAPDAPVLQVSQRLRAPLECRDVAALLVRERYPGSGPIDVLARVASLTPSGLLQLLERCDAWRRPQRVSALIQAAAALSGVDPDKDSGAIRLRKALDAAAGLNQGEIARRHHGRPDAIRAAIDQARLRLITEATDPGRQ